MIWILLNVYAEKLDGFRVTSVTLYGSGETLHLQLVAHSDGFVPGGPSFVLPSQRGQRSRLGYLVFEAIFVVDRALRVLGRFFGARRIVFEVRQQVVRCLHPRLPFKLHSAAKLLPQALRHDLGVFTCSAGESPPFPIAS